MIKFTDYINPLYFFIAFAIGIFFTYISSPPPKIVFKYPTPENSGQITYRDIANNCYKYKANKIKCPNNNSLIIDNIIQSPEIDKELNNDNIIKNIKMNIFRK